MLNNTGPDLSVHAHYWPLAGLCATGHNSLRSPVQPVFSLSQIAFMRSVLKLVLLNSLVNICAGPLSQGSPSGHLDPLALLEGRNDI